jgi:hypothetical protein
MRLVLCQGAWNTVLCNKRHIHLIRQNFVANTMAIHAAAATSSSVWERLTCTSVAVYWIYSLVLTS